MNGASLFLLAVLVLALIYVVNAGYGGGFYNVPTLLSDHYGMGSISAIHGITLSAWAFAGLTGNQAATMIVQKTGMVQYIYGSVLYTKEQAAAAGLDIDVLLASHEMYEVNPTGYQHVLYFTIALYIVALLACLILVRPTDKALAAKAAKKAAKAGKAEPAAEQN